MLLQKNVKQRELYLMVDKSLIYVFLGRICYPGQGPKMSSCCLRLPMYNIRDNGCLRSDGQIREV